MAKTDDFDADHPCPKCGDEMERSRYCGVWVCMDEDCRHHENLARCYCGWSEDGGDGYEELIEMGETIEPEDY